MQGGLFTIGPVEIRQPALVGPRVTDTASRSHVDAVVVVPLVPLSELVAHEQQLLARLREHLCREQSQIGELLPVVAGHFVDERSLAVDDLVVRERQHEVLVERIDHAKRQLVVMIACDGSGLRAK